MLPISLLLSSTILSLVLDPVLLPLLCFARLGLDEAFVDLTPEVHYRIASGNFHEAFQGHIVVDSAHGPQDLPAHGMAVFGSALHPIRRSDASAVRLHHWLPFSPCAPLFAPPSNVVAT